MEEKEEKSDYSKHENYINLYQEISMHGFLKAKKHKKRIDDFNCYIINYLKKNPHTDVRKSALTIYSEKINQFYHEKKKSFFNNLFDFIVVLGTFLMVIATFISLQCGR